MGPAGCRRNPERVRTGCLESSGNTINFQTRNNEIKRKQRKQRAQEAGRRPGSSRIGNQIRPGTHSENINEIEEIAEKIAEKQWGPVGQRECILNKLEADKGRLDYRPMEKVASWVVG